MLVKFTGAKLGSIVSPDKGWNLTQQDGMSWRVCDNGDIGGLVQSDNTFKIRIIFTE